MMAVLLHQARKAVRRDVYVCDPKLEFSKMNCRPKIVQGCRYKGTLPLIFIAKTDDPHIQARVSSQKSLRNAVRVAQGQVLAARFIDVPDKAGSLREPVSVFMRSQSAYSLDCYIAVQCSLRVYDRSKRRLLKRCNLSNAQ